MGRVIGRAERGFLPLGFPSDARLAQVEVTGFEANVRAVMLDCGRLRSPGLIRKRCLSHEQSSHGESAGLIFGYEFRLQIEAISPTIVERIRIRLRAI